MKRREFITLLGGAAATWPFAARGQQADRVHRIAVLMNWSESDPEAQARVAAFEQTLKQIGWRDGHNIRIDYRWTDGNLVQAQESARPSWCISHRR